MEDYTLVSYKELVDKISTSKQKIKQKAYLSHGNIPVVDQGQEKIGGYTNDETKLLECQLPVVVFGDHTKIVKIINFKFAPGADGTKVLQPKEMILPELLAFFTKILVHKIKDKGYARHYQHIENTSFLLPPLTIQRAIVSKLESLLTNLDQGIASLEKAAAQLKIYRQAVLKKAFEGELTKAWREQQTDLPTAEELLAQIKEERLKHYEQQLQDWEQAVTDWEAEGKVGRKPEKPKRLKKLEVLTEKKIKKLAVLPKKWNWFLSEYFFKSVTSGSRGWAKYYSNEGALFIRITNLNYNTLSLDLSEKSNKYVNLPEKAEGKRSRVAEGDFLFSVTGYLGMFAIAESLKEAYVSQHVCIAKPFNIINPKYLGYWIIAQAGGLKYLNEKSKGAVKAGLRLDDIKNFPVPTCSSREQDQIVQEIDSRLSVCDNLAETIETSLKKAKALRQSILKKAFEGRLLTAAELAACRAMPDYEPAAVLLERIKKEKAEREALAKAEKKNKSKKGQLTSKIKA